MSSLEVKASVKSSLEQNGVLAQLRAQLREEVSKVIITGGDHGTNSEADAKPALSNENLLINELIR